MMQSIRDLASGWLGKIILLAIIVTMAFFGIESYFAANVDTYAAKIESPKKFWVFGGDELEIDTNEFNERFQRARDQQRQAQGEAFDEIAFGSVDNKRLVLDQLIDEKLLELAAKEAGLTLSPKQLQDSILNDPTFQVDGKFNADQYRLALKAYGFTPKAYEQYLINQRTPYLLAGMVQASGLASDKDVDEFLKLSGQTRDLRVIELPLPSAGSVAPTDDEIAAWYKANTSRYQSVEQVAVEYVEMDAASLPPPGPPSEETLRQLYEDAGARYRTEDQRSIAAILIKVAADADKAAADKALARARDVVTQARLPGADFAALAATYSDDEATKGSGGDYGVLEKDIFEKAFEEAALALQVDQVSEPVRTKDGWNIIKLTDLQPGEARPFEEVRAELEAQYNETAQERAFSEQVGKFTDRVFADDQKSLEGAAKLLGLPVQRTALFSRAGGDGIAALDEVRKAAFADEQIKDKLVSEGVELGANQLIFLRVIQHQPAAALPLAQVRERVVADINADKLSKAAKLQADTVLKRLQSGTSFDALATEFARTIVPMPQSPRMAQNPMMSSLFTEAFKVSRPNGGPSFGIAKLSEERYLAFEVSAVTDGDPGKLDAATRQSLRQQLAFARGDEERKALLKALRKRYNVTVVESRL